MRAPEPRASTTSTPPWAALLSRSCSLEARRAATGSRRRRPTASCRRSSPSSRPRVAEPLTVLVAARDEGDRIGETIAALREDFPDAEVIVVDGASHDGTAERAEEAG